MAIIDTSIQVYYRVWNTSTQSFEDNDQANHTLSLVSDGTVSVPANAPTRASAGRYELVLTAEENDGRSMELGGTTVTANCVIVPVQWHNVDAMRGTDGANTTVPPSAAAIRTEMESTGRMLQVIHSKLPASTIGDATAASAATAVMNSAVDNTTVLAVLTRILSVASGKTVKVGNTITFYGQDGTTPLFAVTIADNGRTPV